MINYLHLDDMLRSVPLNLVFIFGKVSVYGFPLYKGQVIESFISCLNS